MSSNKNAEKRLETNETQRSASAYLNSAARNLSLAIEYQKAAERGGGWGEAADTAAREAAADLRIARRIMRGVA